MLLVNRASHDTARMMGRGDVAEELRAMSFAIGKLRRRASVASVVLRQANSSKLLGAVLEEDAE